MRRILVLLVTVSSFAVFLSIPPSSVVRVSAATCYGRPDLLWHNYSTGATEGWIMSGRTMTDAYALGPSLSPDSEWILAGSADFNHDGNDDLVWQSSRDGAAVVWFMAGCQRQSSASITARTTPDAHWQIEAIADMNGDGEIDLVYRHRSLGRVEIWYLRGVDRIGGGPTDPPQVYDVRWTIYGAADVNGDGRNDLLWQQELPAAGTGSWEHWLAAWFMNGLRMTSSEWMVPTRAFSGLSPERPVGLVDGDGDGKRDDIVTQSGSLIWGNTVRFITTEGVRQTSLRSISPDPRAPGWYLSGTHPAIARASDADGDGWPDLLLRDAATGRLQLWLMTGTTLRQRVDLPESAMTSDPAWHVFDVADIDGDRKPDVLWQRDDGSFAAWLMDGTRVLEAVPGVNLGSNSPYRTAYDVLGVGQLDLVGQATDTGTAGATEVIGMRYTGYGAGYSLGRADPQWRIVNVGDVNQDGQLDLIWWHGTTGALEAWYLNPPRQYFHPVTVIEPVTFTPERVADTNWRPVGVADFNRDGAPDIVWQHTAGWIQVWLMNGGRLIDSVWLDPARAEGWTVVGVR